ncbi:MAG: hypothetical protein ABIA02_03025 [Candidatus Falkowbacteria bacterium]
MLYIFEIEKEIKKQEEEIKKELKIKNEGSENYRALFMGKILKKAGHFSKTMKNKDLLQSFAESGIKNIEFFIRSLIAFYIMSKYFEFGGVHYELLQSIELQLNKALRQPVW